MQTHFKATGDYSKVYSGAVVYCTSQALVFAYLSDRGAASLSGRTLPDPLFYVILDEADQVLVDNARVTNMISDPQGSGVSDAIRMRIKAATRVARDIAAAHRQVRARPTLVLWNIAACRVCVCRVFACWTVLMQASMHAATLVRRAACQGIVTECT